MKHNTYVEALTRSLRKKNQVLDAIMSANQRQREALEDPNLDPDDFDEIVAEKAALIDQLTQLDAGFDEVFARVKDELNASREDYKDEIREMQQLIRKLTEKNMDIQAQEARNKELMEQKFAAVRRQVKEVRKSQKVVNQYYKNMMKTNYIEPQFTDKKK